jgi:hypothetical protein
MVCAEQFRADSPLHMFEPAYTPASEYPPSHFCSESGSSLLRSITHGVEYTHGVELKQAGADPKAKDLHVPDLRSTRAQKLKRLSKPAVPAASFADVESLAKAANSSAVFFSNIDAQGLDEKHAFRPVHQALRKEAREVCARACVRACVCVCVCVCSVCVSRAVTPSVSVQVEEFVQREIDTNFHQCRVARATSSAAASTALLRYPETSWTKLCANRTYVPSGFGVDALQVSGSASRYCHSLLIPDCAAALRQARGHSHSLSQ